MYKGIRRFAAVALAVAMIAASPLASFAAENDATTGPAFDADLLARVGEEVPTADTSSSDSGQAQAGVAPDRIAPGDRMAPRPVPGRMAAETALRLLTDRRFPLQKPMRHRRQLRKPQQLKRQPVRRPSSPTPPTCRFRF